MVIRACQSANVAEPVDCGKVLPIKNAVMCKTPDILMMCRHQKWTEYLHRITFSTILDVFHINLAQWEVSSCTTTRTTTTTTTLLSAIFSIINYCCRSVPVVGSFKLALRCTKTCRANFLLKLKFFKKIRFCPPLDIPVPPRPPSDWGGQSDLFNVYNSLTHTTAFW